MALYVHTHTHIHANANGHAREHSLVLHTAIIQPVSMCKKDIIRQLSIDTSYARKTTTPIHSQIVATNHICLRYTITHTYIHTIRKRRRIHKHFSREISLYVLLYIYIYSRTPLKKKQRNGK